MLRLHDDENQKRFVGDMKQISAFSPQNHLVICVGTKLVRECTSYYDIGSENADEMFPNFCVIVKS